MSQLSICQPSGPVGLLGWLRAVALWFDGEEHPFRPRRRVDVVAVAVRPTRRAGGASLAGRIGWALLYGLGLVAGAVVLWLGFSLAGPAATAYAVTPRAASSTAVLAGGPGAGGAAKPQMPGGPAKEMAKAPQNNNKGSQSLPKMRETPSPGSSQGRADGDKTRRPTQSTSSNKPAASDRPPVPAADPGRLPNPTRKDAFPADSRTAMIDSAEGVKRNPPARLPSPQPAAATPNEQKRPSGPQLSDSPLLKNTAAARLTNDAAGKIAGVVDRQPATSAGTPAASTARPNPAADSNHIPAANPTQTQVVPTAPGTPGERATRAPASGGVPVGQPIPQGDGSSITFDGKGGYQIKTDNNSVVTSNDNGSGTVKDPAGKVTAVTAAPPGPPAPRNQTPGGYPVAVNSAPRDSNVGESVPNATRDGSQNTPRGTDISATGFGTGNRATPAADHAVSPDPKQAAAEAAGGARRDARPAPRDPATGQTPVPVPGPPPDRSLVATANYNDFFNQRTAGMTPQQRFFAGPQVATEFADRQKSSTSGQPLPAVQPMPAGAVHDQSGNPLRSPSSNASESQQAVKTAAYRPARDPGQPLQVNTGDPGKEPQPANPKPGDQPQGLPAPPGTGGSTTAQAGPGGPATNGAGSNGPNAVTAGPLDRQVIQARLATQAAVLVAPDAKYNPALGRGPPPSTNDSTATQPDKIVGEIVSHGVFQAGDNAYRAARNSGQSEDQAQAAARQARGAQAEQLVTQNGGRVDGAEAGATTQIAGVNVSYSKVTGPDGKPVLDGCTNCHIVSRSGSADTKAAGATIVADSNPGSHTGQSITTSTGARVGNDTIGGTVSRSGDVSTAYCPGSPCTNSARDANGNTLKVEGKSPTVGHSMTVGPQGIGFACPGTCEGSGANKVGPAKVGVTAATGQLTDADLTSSGVGRQATQLGAHRAFVEGTGNTRIDGAQSVGNCAGCTDYWTHNTATGAYAHGSCQSGTGQCDGQSLTSGGVANLHHQCAGGVSGCGFEMRGGDGSYISSNAKGPDVDRRGAEPGVVNTRLGDKVVTDGAAGGAQPSLIQSCSAGIGCDFTARDAAGRTASGYSADHFGSNGRAEFAPEHVLAFQECVGGGSCGRKADDGKGTVEQKSIELKVKDGWGGASSVANYKGQAMPASVETPAMLFETSPGPPLQGIDVGRAAVRDAATTHDVTAAFLPGYVPADGTASPPVAADSAAAVAMIQDQHIRAGYDAALGPIVNDPTFTAEETRMGELAKQLKPLDDAARALSNNPHPTPADVDAYNTVFKPNEAALDEHDHLAASHNAQVAPYLGIDRAADARLNAQTAALAKAAEASPQAKLWLDHHAGELPGSGKPLVADVLNAAAAKPSWDRDNRGLMGQLNPDYVAQMQAKMSPAQFIETNPWVVDDAVKAKVTREAGAGAPVNPVEVLHQVEDGRTAPMTMLQVTGRDGAPKLIDAMGDPTESTVGTYTSLHDFQVTGPLSDKDKLTVLPDANPFSTQAPVTVAGHLNERAFDKFWNNGGSTAAHGLVLASAGALVVGGAINFWNPLGWGAMGVGTGVLLGGAATGAVGGAFYASDALHDTANRYDHGRSLSFGDAGPRANYIMMAGVTAPVAGTAAKLAITSLAPEATTAIATAGTVEKNLGRASTAMFGEQLAEGGYHFSQDLNNPDLTSAEERQELWHLTEFAGLMAAGPASHRLSGAGARRWGNNAPPSTGTRTSQTPITASAAAGPPTAHQPIVAPPQAPTGSPPAGGGTKPSSDGSPDGKVFGYTKPTRTITNGSNGDGGAGGAGGAGHEALPGTMPFVPSADTASGGNVNGAANGHGDSQPAKVYVNAGSVSSAGESGGEVAGSRGAPSRPTPIPVGEHREPTQLPSPNGCAVGCAVMIAASRGDTVTEPVREQLGSEQPGEQVFSTLESHYGVHGAQFRSMTATDAGKAPEGAEFVFSSEPQTGQRGHLFTGRMTQDGMRYWESDAHGTMREIPSTSPDVRHITGGLQVGGDTLVKLGSDQRPTPPERFGQSQEERDNEAAKTGVGGARQVDGHNGGSRVDSAAAGTGDVHPAIVGGSGVRPPAVDGVRPRVWVGSGVVPQRAPQPRPDAPQEPAKPAKPVLPANGTGSVAAGTGASGGGHAGGLAAVVTPKATADDPGGGATQLEGSQPAGRNPAHEHGGLSPPRTAKPPSVRAFLRLTESGKSIRELRQEIQQVHNPWYQRAQREEAQLRARLRSSGPQGATDGPAAREDVTAAQDALRWIAAERGRALHELDNAYLAKRFGRQMKGPVRVWLGWHDAADGRGGEHDFLAVHDRVKNYQELSQAEQYAVVLEQVRRQSGKIMYPGQLAAVMAGSGEHGLTSRFGFRVNPRGVVVEMPTGDGKKLVEASVALKHSLDVRSRLGEDRPGHGAHVATHNVKEAGETRAEYDKLGGSLGLDSGLLEPDNRVPHAGDGTGRTDATVTTPESSTPDADRREQYRRSATFGSVMEFGFDHLRDGERVKRGEQPVQPDHNLLVGDEIDLLLYDLGRNQLRLARPRADDYELVDAWHQAVDGARKIGADPATLVSIDGYNVRITSEQWTKIESLLGHGLDPQQRDHLMQVLQTNHDLRELEHFVIDGSLAVPVPQHVGWPDLNSRWDVHHQPLEALHGLPVRPRQDTIAKTSIGEYLSLYRKVAGYTGTPGDAKTLARYGLGVATVGSSKPQKAHELLPEIWGSADQLNATLIQEAKARRQTGEVRPVLQFLEHMRANKDYQQLLADHGIDIRVLDAQPENMSREAETTAMAGRAGAHTAASTFAGRGTDFRAGGNKDYLVARFGEDPQALTHEEAAVEKAGGFIVEVLHLPRAWRTVRQLFGRGGRQGLSATRQMRLPLEEFVGRLSDKDLTRLRHELDAADGFLTGERAQYYINEAIQRSEKVDDRLLSRTMKGRDTNEPALVRETDSPAPSERARQYQELTERIDQLQRDRDDARITYLEQAGLRDGDGSIGPQLGPAARDLNDAAKNLAAEVSTYRTHAAAVVSSLNAPAATPSQPQHNNHQPAGAATEPALRPPTPAVPPLEVTLATVKLAQRQAANGDLKGAGQTLTQLVYDLQIVHDYADPRWGVNEWALHLAIAALHELNRRDRTGHHGPAPLTGIFAELTALIATPHDDNATQAAAWKAEFDRLLQELARTAALGAPLDKTVDDTGGTRRVAAIRPGQLGGGAPNPPGPAGAPAGNQNVTLSVNDHGDENTSGAHDSDHSPPDNKGPPSAGRDLSAARAPLRIEVALRAILRILPGSSRIGQRGALWWGLAGAASGASLAMLGGTGAMLLPVAGSIAVLGAGGAFLLRTYPTLAVHLPGGPDRLLLRVGAFAAGVAIGVFAANFAANVDIGLHSFGDSAAVVGGTAAARHAAGRPVSRRAVLVAALAGVAGAVVGESAGQGIAGLVTGAAGIPLLLMGTVGFVAVRLARLPAVRRAGVAMAPWTAVGMGAVAGASISVWSTPVALTMAATVGAMALVRRLAPGVTARHVERMTRWARAHIGWWSPELLPLFGAGLMIGVLGVPFLDVLRPGGTGAWLAGIGLSRRLLPRTAGHASVATPRARGAGRAGLGRWLAHRVIAGLFVVLALLGVGGSLGSAVVGDAAPRGPPGAGAHSVVQTGDHVGGLQLPAIPASSTRLAPGSVEPTAPFAFALTTQWLRDAALAVGVPVQQLAADNGIADPDRIPANKTVIVWPRADGTAVIQLGETLDGLAANHGIPVPVLQDRTGDIPNPNKILAGYRLVVTGHAETPSQALQRRADVVQAWIDHTRRLLVTLRPGDPAVDAAYDRQRTYLEYFTGSPGAAGSRQLAHLDQQSKTLDADVTKARSHRAGAPSTPERQQPRPEKPTRLWWLPALLSGLITGGLAFRYVLRRQLRNQLDRLQSDPRRDAWLSGLLAGSITAGYGVAHHFELNTLATALGPIVGALGLVLAILVASAKSGAQKKEIGRTRVGKALVTGLVGGSAAWMASRWAVPASDGMADWWGTFIVSALAVSVNTPLAEYVVAAGGRMFARRIGDRLRELRRAAGTREQTNHVGRQRSVALARLDLLSFSPADNRLVIRKSVDPVLAWAASFLLTYPGVSHTTATTLIFAAGLAGLLWWIGLIRDWDEVRTGHYGYRSPRASTLRAPNRAALWRGPRLGQRIRSFRTRLTTTMRQLGLEGLTRSGELAAQLAGQMGDILDAPMNGNSHRWSEIDGADEVNHALARLRQVAAARKEHHKEMVADGVRVLASYRDALDRAERRLRRAGRVEDAERVRFLDQLIDNLARHPTTDRLAPAGGLAADSTQWRERLVNKILARIVWREQEFLARARLLEALVAHFRRVAPEDPELLRALQELGLVRIDLAREDIRRPSADALGAVAELFDERRRSAEDADAHQSAVVLGLLSAATRLVEEIHLSRSERRHQRAIWTDAFNTAVATAPSPQPRTPLEVLLALAGRPATAAPVTPADLASWYQGDVGCCAAVLAGWNAIGALTGTEADGYRVAAELHMLFRAAGPRLRRALRADPLALPGGDELAMFVGDQLDPAAGEPNTRAYAALLRVLDDGRLVFRHWRDGGIDDAGLAWARLAGSVYHARHPAARLYWPLPPTYPGRARRLRTALRSAAAGSARRIWTPRSQRLILEGKVRNALEAERRYRGVRRAASAASGSLPPEWATRLHAAREAQIAAYGELARAHDLAEKELEKAGAYPHQVEAALRAARRALPRAPSADPDPLTALQLLQRVAGELQSAWHALNHSPPGSAGYLDALRAAQLALERHRLAEDLAWAVRLFRTISGGRAINRASAAAERLHAAYARQLAAAPTVADTAADTPPVTASFGLRHAARRTYRGRGNTVNQDAAALTNTGEVAVAVIADGLSSGTGSEAASRAAVAGAHRELKRTGPSRSAEQASLDAYGAAVDALAGLADLAELNPPATTYLSAIVTPREITVLAVGDTIAVWLPTPGSAAPARLLTEPDTRFGLLTRLLDPHYHPAAGRPVTFHPDSAGLVVLVTDGLWNRFTPATGTPAADYGAALAANLAATLGADAYTDATKAVDQLTAAARAAGSADDVTAVAITVVAPDSEWGAGASTPSALVRVDRPLTRTRWSGAASAKGGR